MVRLEGGGYVDEETVRTARETVGHSITLPEWKNPRGCPERDEAKAHDGDVAQLD